jgi:diaminopimelate decarboxylase
MLRHEILLSSAERFGTPLYLYDQQRVLDQAHALQNALAAASQHKVLLLYAIKANNNPHIIQSILDAGFGLECVSIGEVLLALKLQAKHILYTNNNVHDDEFYQVVKLAADQSHASKIWINCDSLQRLQDLPDGTECFIRINGPVGAGHHDHVITCGPESKFGIHWEFVSDALGIAKRKNLKITGVHQHIGSGVLEPERFASAADILLSVVQEHEFPDLQYMNFGGGIGVPYRPDQSPMDLAGFSAMLAERFDKYCSASKRKLTLMLEPGRFLVAQSGYLISRVNTIKENPSRVFIGVDTGFNHLVRPTMYGSYHRISNASNPEGILKSYYVAGNVCETGDIFTRADAENRSSSRELSEVRLGDVLVVHDVGAYGYAMASEYNMRPRPAEAMITTEGHLKLVRTAKSIDQLIQDMLIL